ncbi:MAG: general secretion pathway protein GspK, partial [Bdellovibrionales bacterium]|nr:general secretion pathway protein GspK [Bdellovibrionales bacterium]
MQLYSANHTLQKDERGVALIIVLGLISLTTILVTQLTYSATLDMRLHLMAKRSLEAEYLLKSAVNLGRALIKEDTSPEDAYQDTWAQFRDGLEIPRELLQVEDPSVRVELEIRPEESKIPIRSLLSGRSANSRWRDVFARLFQKLGFDEDEEEDQTGLFPGRVFKADELVANLIDYMDPDSDPYQVDDFAQGIESESLKDAFPNRPIRWLGELNGVPGFTTNRIRLMQPFLTTFGSGRRVNINLAPRAVLESLHPEIGTEEVDAILAFREEQPFDNTNRKTELGLIIGESTYDDITTMITVESRWFQLLAKVDYGASSSFMRAYVVQGNSGELPILR